MRSIILTSLLFLVLPAAAQAKAAKGAAKSGGHPRYARTLIYPADGVKSPAHVVLPEGALAGVKINAPLLTLEKKKGAVEGENIEVETTTLTESSIKLAPAKAKE